MRRTKSAPNYIEIVPMDIYFSEKINTDGASESLHDSNLLSQTPISENIIIKQIPFVIRNDIDTLPNEKLKSANDATDDSVMVPVEVESMSILSSILENEKFETGVVNPSENFFNSLFQKDKLSACNGLSTLFMNNFSTEGKKTNILVGALHIISHIGYDDVYPIGQMMAISALSHKNREVAEFGVKCFENWGKPDGAEKLKAVRFSTSWLQDYANDVIEELAEGG